MSLSGQLGILGPQPGILSFQLDHTQGAGQVGEVIAGQKGRSLLPVGGSAGLKAEGSVLVKKGDLTNPKTDRGAARNVDSQNIALNGVDCAGLDPRAVKALGANSNLRFFRRQFGKHLGVMCWQQEDDFAAFVVHREDLHAQPE